MDEDLDDQILWIFRIQGHVLMKMTLRHMEVFRAIILAGSVSAAARMLFVSQSVVSRTLAHLESRIGFALFIRTGGALRPTENALALFRDVSEVFNAAERVEMVIQKMGLPARGRVAFCASPSLSFSVIPSAISDFVKSDPSVQFSVKTSLIQEMPSELLGKSSEFSLSIWPIDHPNLDCVPLFTGRLKVAFAKGHRLAALDRVAIDDLKDLPLISFMSDQFVTSQINQRFQAAGAVADPIVEVSRSDIACALARRGVGVALVYSFSVDDDAWAGLEVRDIHVDIPVFAYLITSKFSPLSSLSARFVEFLCNSAESFGYERLP
ncbi:MULTISPECIES: LysR substrate-binding domain-containing protein [unclassified Variovorax]|uniref:LysR family transcriptional regulator n=2 Tax=Variovorax TaxID=34072 RepID=UPI0009FFED79|nr:MULTISPECIES: LysR substrate-binding domain-containing protein [unclassified Variovorax]